MKYTNNWKKNMTQLCKGNGKMIGNKSMTWLCKGNGKMNRNKVINNNWKGTQIVKLMSNCFSQMNGPCTCTWIRSRKTRKNSQISVYSCMLISGWWWNSWSNCPFPPSISMLCKPVCTIKWLHSNNTHESHSLELFRSHVAHYLKSRATQADTTDF